MQCVYIHWRCCIINTGTVHSIAIAKCVLLVLTMIYAKTGASNLAAACADVDMVNCLL